MNKYWSVIGVFFLLQPAFAVLPTPSSNPNLKETQNPDIVLTEKVQAQIHNSPQLKNQPVSAAYQAGEVILQGSVETKEQEKTAITAAKSVPGVKTVTSQLNIGNHGDLNLIVAKNGGITVKLQNAQAKKIYDTLKGSNITQEGAAGHIFRSSKQIFCSYTNADVDDSRGKLLPATDARRYQCTFHIDENGQMTSLGHI